MLAVLTIWRVWTVIRTVASVDNTQQYGKVVVCISIDRVSVSG